MPFWDERRVLVTGATGMVGSWLVKELVANGAEVVALVLDTDPQSELNRSGLLERVAVVNGSIENFWTLERAINQHEIDTVFHLAAQTIVGTAYRSPLPTFEANIRGTYNLLEACRLHGKLVDRVVIASSDKAYGEQQELPYTETMPLVGKYPYDVSKSCADMIAQAYHQTYGMPVAIARCGNVYGGGDLNWSRIVPGSIRSLLAGQRPIIRSDGHFVRDYIYVKDVARAYMRLAECLPEEGVAGGAFNFSTETPMTVLEIVKLIQGSMDALAVQPEIMNTARGEIHSQYLSAAKAHNLLQWRPTFAVEDALNETVSWYRLMLAEWNAKIQ